MQWNITETYKYRPVLSIEYTGEGLSHNKFSFLGCSWELVDKNVYSLCLGMEQSQSSLALPPLRMERKGLVKPVYMTRNRCKYIAAQSDYILRPCDLLERWPTA